MGGKVIRDPIHGNIRLGGEYVAMVDTPEFQRLRNIKQNGLCFLVYPAMNSTRFEHSLGVHHLGGLVSGNLSLPEKERGQVQAACLLHDLGHGPFSHTFDELLMSHGLEHEDESCRIILKTGISDLLKEAGISPAKVADLVKGKGKLGKLLSSEVDVDKMDYLVRDAYYAGVAYGVTDVERLLNSLTLEGGDVVVDFGGLEAAESLLINRNLMYQTVYRHHTKRIAESMMQHGVERMIEGGASIEEIFRMDDVDLIHMMRSWRGYVKDMISRIEGRRLFKNVFSERISLLTDDSKRELSKRKRQVEERIASDLRIKEGYLMVDYPETSMSEYKVRMRTPQGLRSIADVSALAKSLESSERDKLTVNIYARPEDKAKFRGFRPERYLSYRQAKISGYM
jgi:uncharacterized protein